jgi:hypothetical protein
MKLVIYKQEKCHKSHNKKGSPNCDYKDNKKQ